MEKNKKRAVLLLGLTLVLSMTIAPITTAAVEYTSIQLTDNDVNDGFGGASDGFIVWYSGEGDAREIFLYDANTDTITQITNNDYSDTIPKVHEGLVTWLARPPDGDDYEVFLYDHSSGITTRITDNDLNDNHPQIHEGLVTWYAWEGTAIGLAQIYLYDSSTGQTIQISHNTYANYYPQIQNGLVTWRGHSQSLEIFLYDYSTGHTTQITENTYIDDAPQIHEGLVVWRALVDGTVKLFLYDSISQSTTFIEDIVYTRGFVLHDGQVAYVAPENPDVPLEETDFEIFLYDYFDDTKTQITTNDYDDYVDDLYAGKVVWTAIEGGSDYEVFLHNSVTGVTDQITDNLIGDEIARVTSGFVTWMGRGGGTGSDYEIFIAGLASTSDVDFDPNTLNLDSKGRWVTVYIELPRDSEYTAEDIDISTVMLNGLVSAETNPYAIGDYDADGIIDLMVKFDRSAVQAVLMVGDEVTVTITGTLPDGSLFVGTDVIRVISV